MVRASAVFRFSGMGVVAWNGSVWVGGRIEWECDLRNGGGAILFGGVELLSQSGAKLFGGGVVLSGGALCSR